MRHFDNMATVFSSQQNMNQSNDFKIRAEDSI